MVSICEYCGAAVHGDVCEYCNMPVNKNPAPPKITYKHEKSAKTASMPVIKNKKKFIRTILAGALLVCTATTVTMAVMANSNQRHIQEIPVERAIDYNENGNNNNNNNNAYYYDDGFFDDDDDDDDFDDFFDDDDDDDHHKKRPEYDKNQSFKDNGIFPSGTYQIGVDIPEGIYIFVPELPDNHGVEGVYSDPECENQISSAYVHFDGTRIAEISGNGYLNFSWATAYDLDMHPEIVNDPHKKEGMFIVGRDIPAGTYNLEPYGEYGDLAEWYIYSGINAVGAVLKESGQLYSNDDYNENITDEITLSDGEYFELRHCIITE